MKRWRSSLPLALVLALLAACGDSLAPGVPSGLAPLPTEPVRAEPRLTESIIDTELISESSGLARSQRRDDVLWTLNDSGGATELYAITTSGRHLATLAINGAPANADWEDLVSFTQNGSPQLLIGDIGDNGAFRPNVIFYRVTEPELTAANGVQALSATVSAIYSASYPDGPRDAESLAVDPVENNAYVLSKRDAQPQLYRFPLTSLGPVGVPALMDNLGPINIPRAPAGFAGNPDSFNWTTAMDFDDTLSRAYVGTLSQGYFWDRAAGETWAEAFARPPRGFDLPDYPQIEAGSFARGRRDAVYLTSEQLPARLARLVP